MRIAFHTPLNAYEDGRISGDRRMAHQLVEAMTRLGHAVAPIADARSYMRSAEPALLDQRLAEAAGRRDALLAAWETNGNRPGLWFTYHSYYKAPDLLGPEITKRLDIPYVVAEASDSGRRSEGEWARHVALARRGFRAADLHFCFTERDRGGVEARSSDRTQFLELPPFVALEPSTPHRRSGAAATRLITVAMMRPGVKLESYQALAASLARLIDRPWTLTIIGDGPVRDQVEAAFAPLPRERIEWRGALDRPAVGAALAEHDIFVWPGIGEAYGLVYLEAQAAGLPVVAFDSGGVAATVRNGETAILVQDGDLAALATALVELVENTNRREDMGRAARNFVLRERTLNRTSEIISHGLALAQAARAAHRVARAESTGP